jgi:hypothetical protein
LQNFAGGDDPGVAWQNSNQIGLVVRILFRNWLTDTHVTIEKGGRAMRKCGFSA